MERFKMSEEIIVILVCLGFFALMVMISDLMTRKFVTEIFDIIFKSQMNLQDQINKLISDMNDKNTEDKK